MANIDTSKHVALKLFRGTDPDGETKVDGKIPNDFNKKVGINVYPNEEIEDDEYVLYIRGWNNYKSNGDLIENSADGKLSTAGISIQGERHWMPVAFKNKENNPVVKFSAQLSQNDSDDLTYYPNRAYIEQRYGYNNTNLSNYWEKYYLPKPSSNLSEDTSYEIFTSKGIVDHSVKIRSSDGSNGNGVSFGFYPDKGGMALIYGGRASSNNIYHFSRFLFFVASYDSSTGEPLTKGDVYRLGTAVSADMTTDSQYDIFTSKQSGPATTTTVTSGVVSRSSGATLVSQSVSQWGKMVTCSFRIRNTEAVAVGSDVFTGTVASGYRPASQALGLSYYGSSGLLCAITPSGGITVRNTGAQLATGSEAGVSVTYVIP